MYLSAIESWLKSTIPGIILLGTLGSIVAIFILQLVRNIFAKWIPQGFSLFKKYESKRKYKRGYIAGYIIASNDTVKINILLSYVLSRLIISLFCFLFFSLLFAYLLPKQSNNLLTFGTYISIVLAILSLRWVWTETNFFKFLYTKPLEEILKKAEESYRKNETKKND